MDEKIDWIQGDKFIGLADYTYAPSHRREDDYGKLPNTLDIDKLEDYDIIYTHTFYAKQLFNEIELVNKKLIIVTHNSDVNVDNSFMLPDNVIKWYTQNVNTSNPRIESIPIGLENNRWFKGIHKKEKMLAKLKEPRKYKNLVYMNHNIATNPAKRTKPYEVLKDESWVTVDMHPNGYNFDSYLDNIYNHKFVVCPEGNGIDTHRIWECLYMGTIPITEDNINMSFYKDLPTLKIIKDWDELTVGYLDRYVIGVDAFHGLWSYDILTFEYWKHKITGE